MSTNSGAISAIKGVFDSMKRLFPVTKTLAFRLIPVGKTSENIAKTKVISGGRELHEQYVVLSKAADRIHKDFIERTLAGLRLKAVSDGGNDSVQDYAEVFFNKGLDAKEKERILGEIGTKLKARVAAAFKGVRYDEKDTMLKALASKRLVTELLPPVLVNDTERLAQQALSRYTTYMRPYFEARNRIYDEKIGGHTIPVRIVEDNLPIHMANVTLAGKIPGEVFDTFGENDFFRDFLKANTYAIDVRDVFTPTYASLLCAQSAIDVYNTLIGGVSEDAKVRHKGLNELINEYNQAHKGANLKKLSKLKKQILSDRDTLSWLPVTIKDDKEILSIVKTLKERLLETFGHTSLNSLCYNPEKGKAYVKNISAYSHEVYGRWDVLEYAMKRLLAERNPKSSRMSEKGYAEKIDKLYKHLGPVSVEELEHAATLNGDMEKISMKEFIHVNIVKTILSALAEYKKLDEKVHLETEPILSEPLGQSKDGKQGAGAIVKQFLDYVNAAVRTARLFVAGDGDLDYDIPFYEGTILPLQAFADEFVPAYNSVRNYLTKKPYSLDKFELKFDCPELLGGWDKDVVETKRSVILIDGNSFYLGILAPGAKKLFSGPEFLEAGSSMELLRIKSLKDAHMTLPKVAFAKSPSFKFERPEGVLALYNSKKPVKDYTREEVTMMVDFYKGLIAANPAWDVLGFHFKESSEYGRLNDFFEDFDRQSYKCYREGVSRHFIDDAVERGALYLFEITCQDMAAAHLGKDGDFKMLFMEAVSGRPGSLVRLNGGGAVYYRPASLEKKVTHPAGVPIENKNPDNPRKTRTLPYDLYKDKRFMEDRYAFHVSVTIYPDADRKGADKINAKVQELIRENPGMYVLGINRGERNLISAAVVAPDGRIVEQRHFNVFDNYNYLEALVRREHERTDDRQNWNAVRDIKNLKKGYLSRVVGEVVSLVKKYGCIVAMERLDMEFKNSRQAFERNVYEQFERDLIGKLSLMMDKSEGTPELRVASGLQLTNPGKTVADRARYPQSGIVFLMNPSWITKTDPLTGFVNRLNTHYKSVEESEAFMQKMDAFSYDPKTDRFYLKFRYEKVAPEKETGDGTIVWRVETFGERIENVFDTGTNPKGVWVDKVHDITAEMKELFDENGIAWKNGEDLLCQLSGRSAEFWKTFYGTLRLTLQNTSWNSQTREFRVIGCTAKDGRFYDSRMATDSMPMDADINAAWNIARKTHLVLKGIREYKPDDVVGPDGKKPKGPSTVLTDAQWMEFVQGLR